MTANHNLSRTSAIWVILASAALFGVATSAVKPLIAGVAPQLAAGVLYLGMGVGLALVYLGRGMPAVRIPKGKGRWLAVSLLCGGIIAPWLIYWSLSQASASATSLLVNTEVVFSTVLARFWFGEHYSGRLFLGVGLIAAGALALSGLQGGIDPVPAIAIVVACALWGIDNNAMRKVSSADASFIGCAKGVCAGTVNVLIALAWGASLPKYSVLLAIAAVGFLCYGVSFSLYVVGLRVLGAARTSAFYGTAPFAGALVGVGFLHEPLTGGLVLAAALMGAGVWLHVVEPQAVQ